MHELVQNEKNKEKSGRARPPLQTRTGPNASSNKRPSLSIEEKQQQKRVAARAATAMAQVLRRRREARPHMIWADQKKAIIKRYPDGGYEIIVPQTLTPEQENFQFPPRSKFLKKLATSTTERRVFQDHVAPSAPTPITAADHLITPTPSCNTLPQPLQTTTPTTTASADMRQPDQLALNEWFSQKVNTNRSTCRPNKDRAVMDWMIDVERSSTETPLPVKRAIMSPTPPSSQSHKIQFKSDAAKRSTNSIIPHASLVPPNDTCRKHYVPRRLLVFTKKDDSATAVETAANKIQAIWKEYQNISTSVVLENKVGMVAMATTGQRTPIAGMVHLMQRLHQSYEQRQLDQQKRMAEIESVLKAEICKRQQAEERLQTVHRQQQHMSDESTKKYPSRLSQVKRRESHSRKTLPDQLLSASPRPRPVVASGNMSLKSKEKTPVNRSHVKTSSRDRTSSLAHAGAAIASSPRRSTLARSSNIKK